MPTQKTPFKSGWISIVGRPNAGKSTLLNRLVGQSVSIITARPQTTRTRVLGVKHDKHYQMVFIDTAGVQMGKTLLNKSMLAQTWESISEADLNLVLVDHSRAFGMEQRRLFNEVKKNPAPAWGIITKEDLATDEDITQTLDALSEEAWLDKTYVISAKKGTGMQTLITALEHALPVGEALFPRGQVTDQSPVQWVAEWIRQAIYTRLGDELPYATAVEVTYIEPRPLSAATAESKALQSTKIVQNNPEKAPPPASASAQAKQAFQRSKLPLWDVEATIYVARDSQRGIVIGKNGRMLEAIGKQARYHIERLLQARVNLQIHVDILPSWNENPQHLARFGFSRY